MERIADDSLEALVTADEVSHLTGMRRSWVYEKAWQGDLPCYRFGRAIRFRISEVLAFIEASRHCAHRQSS